VGLPEKYQRKPQTGPVQSGNAIYRLQLDFRRNVPFADQSEIYCSPPPIYLPSRES
jgi:hypothetical protein